MSALTQAQDALREKNVIIDNQEGLIRRLERSNQAMGERLNRLEIIAKRIAETSRCYMTDIWELRDILNGKA